MAGRTAYLRPSRGPGGRSRWTAGRCAAHAPATGRPGTSRPPPTKPPVLYWRPPTSTARPTKSPASTRCSTRSATCTASWSPPTRCTASATTSPTSPPVARTRRYRVPPCGTGDPDPTRPSTARLTETLHDRDRLRDHRPASTRGETVAARRLDPPPPATTPATPTDPWPYSASPNDLAGALAPGPDDIEAPRAGCPSVPHSSSTNTAGQFQGAHQLCPHHSKGSQWSPDPSSLRMC